jgi:hypothetical protein
VAGGASLFSDTTPTDIFCKHVHYLAVQNVTLGCDTARYCPDAEASRLEMAALIAKAIVAPSGEAGVPQIYGPDPLWGTSYSCDPASPRLRFVDVPASDPFCKYVHYLWAKRIIDGCGPGQYCPLLTIKRDEMSKFLANAFSLDLNGD